MAAIQIDPFNKSHISAGANSRCPRRLKPKQTAIGRHITAQTANKYRMGRNV